MVPKALSLSKSISLLPQEFTPHTIINRQSQMIQTPLGIVEFHASKEYIQNSMPIWWTATRTLEKYDVKWILIALGFDGVILMPYSMIIDYARKYRISILKGGRQNIRIKKLAEKYFMYDSRAEDVDITEYFISI